MNVKRFKIAVDALLLDKPSLSCYTITSLRR